MSNFDYLYKILKKTHLIIVYFIPFFLVSGPFFSDLAVVLSSLFFIFFSFKEKKFYYYNNKFFIFFIVWCLYIILLSLFSINIILSLESSLFYFRFGFFALSIWYLLEHNKNFLYNFLKSFFFIFIILFIDSLIQFYFGKNIIGFGYTGSRLSSFFGEEKILGSFISRLTPLFILFLFVSEKFRNPFFIFVLFTSIIFLIFLTGERSALLYLLISISVIILSLKYSLINKLLFMIMFFILSIIIIFSSNNIYERVVLDTYKNFYKNNNIYIFSKFHQNCYNISINEFFKKPLIGIGPKISRQIYKNKIDPFKDIYGNEVPECISHPHNYYIQLLSETGIIGATPIIILFLFLFYNILKNIFFRIFLNKEFLDFKLLIFYLLIFINLFPFVPAGNFFNNWISILHFLPLGFIAYYNNKINK